MYQSFFQEGNVTTEIIDMTEGKGHLSTDEILGKTGGGAGVHTEVGPDGKTYTYSVEVEEVRQSTLITYMIYCHITLQILKLPALEILRSSVYFARYTTYFFKFLLSSSNVSK